MVKYLSDIFSKQESGVKRLLKPVLWLWLAGASLPGWADEACLLLAETYYEQIFCELKALGQGGKLPAFYDFRRNDEMTQALLLKRPAAKVGVGLAMPVRQKTEMPAPQKAEQFMSTVQDGACRLEGISLHCSDSHYRLVANKGNDQLPPGVLGDANRMGIPDQPGRMNGGQQLDYLRLSYRQYLSKMLEIGLGGSTFSFRKFVYLYEDVTSRGLDFRQRFETMFGFLKKDKRNMSVSERLPDIGNLKAASCEPLDEGLAVCDGGYKNLVFIAAD